MERSFRKVQVGTPIFDLLKTVFEEELTKQQQQISKIIENNLVITKQEIGKLRVKINNLKKSIESTENVFEEKVTKVEQNVCKLQGKFEEVEEDVTYMKTFTINWWSQGIVRDEIT